MGRHLVLINSRTTSIFALYTKLSLSGVRVHISVYPRTSPSCHWTGKRVHYRCGRASERERVIVQRAANRPRAFSGTQSRRQRASDERATAPPGQPPPHAVPEPTNCDNPLTVILVDCGTRRRFDRAKSC